MLQTRQRGPDKVGVEGELGTEEWSDILKALFK